MIKYSASFNSPKLDSNLKSSLKDIAKDVNQIKNDIFDLKSVLNLSVDMKDFFKFKTIVPFVSKIQRHENEKLYLEFWIPGEEKFTKESFTEEQTKFCFDFTIELALRSQSKKIK